MLTILAVIEQIFELVLTVYGWNHQLELSNHGVLDLFDKCCNTGKLINKLSLLFSRMISSL